MSGILQYAGVAGLTFKDFEVRGGPKGDTTNFRVTSPNIGALVTYRNYLISFGASVDFRGVDGGADRELVVEYPGLTTETIGILSELFFDQWELLANESTDTIFSNPLIVSGASPVLNYNDRVVLSRLARDGGTITDAVSSCNSDISDGNLTAPNPSNGGTSGNLFQKPSTGAATQLTLEILKGQTEYERPTQVLRHTSYCSATSTYNSSHSNVMKIYTTSQLLTEVGSGWTYPLPARLYSEISAIPTQFAPGDEAAYYRWGWLKKVTREPVRADFMVEISTEYELGLWSTLRYAPF